MSDSEFYDLMWKGTDYDEKVILDSIIMNWGNYLRTLEEYLKALKTVERITPEDYDRCHRCIEGIRKDFGYPEE